MEKIKVAIFGIGFMGRVHTEALRRLGNIEVIGVAGRTTEAARAFADNLGIERATGNYEDLLADADVSTVHICALNALHFPMAMAAMRAGKHVLCEKPLASTIAEAEAMIALAHEKQLANCTLYNVRSYPQLQNMRGMCKAGEFGEVYVVQGTYSQDWLLYDTDWNWRIESGPSRTFADIGTHWCDLAEHVTGLRMTSLCADLQTFHRTRKKPKHSVQTFAGKTLQPDDYAEVAVKTEDFGAMVFAMGERARGALTVSQVSAGRKNRLFLEVFGSRASAAWSGESPEELWIGHRNEPNHILMRDPVLMRLEARSFTDLPGVTARATLTLSNKPFAASTRELLIATRRLTTPPSRMGFASYAYWTRSSRVRRRRHGSTYSPEATDSHRADKRCVTSTPIQLI